MYFIDVQGTLISDSDKTPINGSLEFIKHLNQTKTPYMVVTNNTKKSSQEFYNYLTSLGFDFSFEQYIDPLMTLESLVKKEKVSAYGSREFLETLKKMGYELDYENPQTVLIAIKEDFSADEYAQMIDFILGGASLVGMHETSIYAKNNKRYPGVGAILKLLEFATSSSYTVVGKPSVAFYNEALKRLQKQDNTATFDSITMISDDVKGDLGGIKALGAKTIFVTSGKYKNAQEIIPFLDENEKPDTIYKDMQEVLENL
ncbi:NagD, Predicted sugar phosphatases of the HAD superfamily [hydrothermal vent metagenome]|uniref:NagD, Predicted sugar phosphatases of the HAD superfamily n=1 Tax=hydrothermal vent metagenome TaxID=652676 RepID=A0A1W1D4B8_9ZZZZ